MKEALFNAQRSRMVSVTLTLCVSGYVHLFYFIQNWCQDTSSRARPLWVAVMYVCEKANRNVNDI